MRKRDLAAPFILFLATALISCKQGDTNNYYPTSFVDTTGTNTNFPHTVVTDNPSATISFADMASFQRGTLMRLRLNRTDLEVWEVDVVFDALYTEGADRLILCHTNNGVRIGSGDSGSPLLTADGRVAGILCYGYYGNSTDFCARTIDDVLTVSSNTVNNSVMSDLFKVVEPVFSVSGYDPHAPSRYSVLGNGLGNNYKMLDGGPSVHRDKLMKSAGTASIPGSSIAVMIISGDYYTQFAVGTMSYMNNGTDLAFGHSYRTLLAAPTYLASNKTFITTVEGSFKMAEPTQQLIGSFVKDDFNGVMIKENVAPLVANVTTSCSVNGQGAFLYHHQISNTPSFAYDRSLAANLCCYLLYVKMLTAKTSLDTLTAYCEVSIVTDRETRNASFAVRDAYIDAKIYYYIQDSILTSSSNKELKSFSLAVDLRE